MPILDDTKELVILELEEWEKLSELEFGDLKPHSTGGNFQDRKIVVKQVRSLYDQESDTLYPYITYYNNKGVKKTERLVKCDKVIRAIFSKEDGSETKGRYNSFLEVVTAAQGLEGLNQIRMAYTLDLYNWYEHVTKLHVSLSQGLFPTPVLIRRYVGVAHEELPNTVRNYIEVIPLDK